MPRRAASPSAGSCTERRDALACLGRNARAFVSFLDDPRDHQELTNRTHSGVTRPLHDVEAVYTDECLVLLARVPPETVVIDGSQGKIPFPGTDSEPIKIDDYRVPMVNRAERFLYLRHHE